MGNNNSFGVESDVGVKKKEEVINAKKKIKFL